MTDLPIDRPTASEPVREPAAREPVTGGSLADRAWRHRHEIVGLALVAAIWVAIVVFSEPFGRLWGTGQDAYCYWFPSLDAPYARSDWTDPIAYVYSPAFLQLLQPIRVLPWQLYVAVWTAILIGAVYVLTGRKWLAVGVVLGLMELAGGNIHLLLAAAMVLGFRWPATWALVLLTKITPGIGLLWFVVRGEWRQLAIALGATAVVVAVSFATMPDAWFEWVGVLTRIAGRDGTWAAVPIPFLVRLPFAVALVVWGARTDRRWTVPVAGMLALPA
ncbi:MAG TPA: glycosyltransferase family 87 protein, partial [Methylomirabilota bacterium]|nr:glycosyltransferase family 87 protein [Methylomirabilota bacterium]